MTLRSSRGRLSRMRWKARGSRVQRLPAAREDEMAAGRARWPALPQAVVRKAVGEVQVVAGRVQAQDGVVVERIHLVVACPTAVWRRSASKAGMHRRAGARHGSSKRRGPGQRLRRRVRVLRWGVARDEARPRAAARCPRVDEQRAAGQRLGQVKVNTVRLLPNTGRSMPSHCATGRAQAPAA